MTGLNQDWKECKSYLFSFYLNNKIDMGEWHDFYYTRCRLNTITHQHESFEKARSFILLLPCSVSCDLQLFLSKIWEWLKNMRSCHVIILCCNRFAFTFRPKSREINVHLKFFTTLFLLIFICMYTQFNIYFSVVCL